MEAASNQATSRDDFVSRHAKMKVDVTSTQTTGAIDEKDMWDNISVIGTIPHLLDHLMWQKGRSASCCGCLLVLTVTWGLIC